MKNKRGARRDPAKERFWRQTLGQQVVSGQSVRAFCRQRQLNESAFYFWRRELEQRQTQKEDNAKRDALFVPVVAGPVAETTGSSMEMVLPSGAVLRLSGRDMDAVIEWIAKVEAQLC
jgi:transposase-like protein